MKHKTFANRWSRAIVLAGLCLAGLNYRPAKALTNWWVAPGGNDAWSCQSQAAACKTIQAAIKKAANGDVVSIAAGTYSSSSNGESFPIDIEKPLVINGQGAATTIVDASGSGWYVFQAVGSIGVFISNLTMRGGTYGLYLGGNLSGNIWGEISHNNITGNSTGGIWIVLSDVNASSTLIQRNMITWNGDASAVAAGIHNTQGNPTIVNNLIGWNNGHGIFNDDSDAVITNNTIAFNLGGTGIANMDVSRPKITNNIVTFNGHHGIYADGSSSPTNTYNDVWGNSAVGPGWTDYYGTSGGTGSLSADPKFVSLLDAHLQFGSPALNAGNNSAPAVPSYDLDGNPRPFPVGGVVDIGAYERQSSAESHVLLLPFIKK